MPGYEIKKEDNKYYFVLYPHNSNTQELGKSIKYNTQEKCIKARADFINLVKQNTINSLKSQHIKTLETGHMAYINEKGQEIFFTRNTNKPKINGNKTIDSIYRNIDSEWKRD